MLRHLLLGTSAHLPLYAADEGAGNADTGELPLGDKSNQGNAGNEGQGQQADAGGDQQGAGGTEGQQGKEGAAGAQAGDQGGQQQPKRRASAPKWAMERINEETNAKAQAQAEVERLRRENEELLRRQLTNAAGSGQQQQSGTGTQGTGTGEPAAPQRQQFTSQAEFDRAVELAAEVREFTKATQTVLDNGMRDYENFSESLDILGKAGVIKDDAYVADLIAATDVTSAHKLIQHLADDPDTAKRIQRMSSRQRVAEFVKMAAKLSPQGQGGNLPKQVSRAGAPLRHLEGAGQTSDNEFGDQVSDDDWSAKFDKKYGLNQPSA